MGTPNQPESFPQGKLHICLVTETYPPEINGVAMTLHRLAQGLQQRGHRVSLIRPRQTDSDSTQQQANDTQHLVYGLPIPGYRDLRFGLPLGKKLQQFLKHAEPDILYIATQGPLGRTALHKAQQLGIPVVSGFHTNFHQYANHYHLNWLSTLIFAYLRHFHNRTASTLVANRNLQSWLQQNGFDDVNILERGVDCQQFSPQQRDRQLRRQWGVNDDSPVVLYVGRIAVEKNIALLLRSYQAMRDQTPKLRCVMVGDGPLRRQLQKNNPDIIFCGEQTGSSLAAHYASADIFLFPSETETFGNVTLEAMASGLAVVAYDYAAANRHITDQVNGHLVPFSDESCFVDTAVSLLQTDKTKLAQLRIQARNIALTIDWPEIIQKFEILLRKISQQSC